MDIDEDMIPVNYSFAHWVKVISITKYGSDKELIPTFSPYKTYQYADGMLKHLPEKALKTIQTTHLYSKKTRIYANETMDCRIHNGDGAATPGLYAAQAATRKAAFAKDVNIDNRISKFKNIIKNGHVYRVSLIYFTDLGKINFPTKIDYRIKLYLEKEMKILFESKKLLATGTAKPSSGAQIIFTKAPFIQYGQILLDNNNEAIMVPKKIC